MGKTRKNRKLYKSPVRGWAKQAPGTHQRTMMLKRCGNKCFLGPNKSFPVCSKGTCKFSKKGALAAYMRAREYMTIRGTPEYTRVAKKARALYERL
jgi:hypothetical protein